MQISKTYLTVFSTFLCGLIFTASSHAESTRKVILSTVNTPPYFYEENGDFKGLNKDFIDLISQETGYTITTQLRPWSRAQKMLERGESDFAFMFKSAEREKIYDFSKEHVWHDGSYFFTTAKNDISYTGELTDLTGSKVGLLNTLNYGPQIQQAIAYRTLKNIHYGNSIEDLVKLLTHNRVDVIAGLQFSIAHVAKEMNASHKLKRLSPAINSSQVFIAYSKKPENQKLREDFDKAIVAMRERGDIQEIYDRYMTISIK